MPDLTVVLVEWLAPVPPTRPPEPDEPFLRPMDTGPVRPRVSRAVGYLLEETADTLVIAQHLVPTDDEVARDVVGTVLEIPRFLVQRLLTILPKWFDRLTEAEQTEWLGLMNAELLDLMNGQ